MVCTCCSQVRLLRWFCLPLPRRSRKPVFKRVRQLQERNSELEALVQAQSDRIAALEWQLAAERTTIAALTAECDTVRAATETMSAVVAESEGSLGAVPLEGPPAGDGGVSAEEIEHAGAGSWIWKGVCRVFEIFDSKKDGVLDVEEMNALQVGEGGGNVAP